VPHLRLSHDGRKIPSCERESLLDLLNDDDFGARARSSDMTALLQNSLVARAARGTLQPQ